MRELKTVVEESDSKGKGSGKEYSSKPEKLHINTNSISIKQNSAKNGFLIRLCQVHFIQFKSKSVIYNEQNMTRNLARVNLLKFY